MPTTHPTTLPLSSPTALSARLDRRDLLPLCLILVVFITLAALFLPHQSLWQDEATQLRGLAMTPAELLSFVTGRHAPIGVSPDRSPPLAYWAGQFWSSLFGLSEHSMRWFGLTCTALAIAFTYAAGRRFGRVPAILAASFLAVSPTVITTSVEIRSYPLFLLLSAAAFLIAGSLTGGMVLRSSQDHVAARGAILTIVLIATIYTHFFGLLLAGAILSAWLLESLLRRQSLILPILVSLIVFASAGGLYPFVHAAKSVSGAAPEQSSILLSLVKFPIHILAPAPMRFSLIGSGILFSPLVLALAAAVIALPLGLFRAAASARSRPLAFAVSAGLLAVAFAAVVVKGFNPLAPNYNVWLLPPLAILLGLAAAAVRRPIRFVGATAAIALLTASAFGSIQLIHHAPAFAHGPQSQIFALIDQYGPQNVTLIQDLDVDAGASPTPPPGEDFSILFPLRLHYGPALQRYSVNPQSLATAWDDNARVANNLGQWEWSHGDFGGPLFRLAPDTVPFPPPLRQYVIILRTRDYTGEDLAAAIKSPPQPLPPGPAAAALAANPDYHKISSSLHLALVSAQVTIYERNESK